MHTQAGREQQREPISGLALMMSLTSHAPIAQLPFRGKPDPALVRALTLTQCMSAESPAGLELMNKSKGGRGVT